VNVLVSGGIDSAALLAFYQQQKFSVRALFVDFGQPAAKQELRAARSVSRHYRVQISTVTVRNRASFSAGEIKGRNAFLIFAAVLMNWKGPGVIAIGIHEGLPYYDCGEGFVTAIQAIVDGYSSGSVRIAAPFLKWDKPTIWAFCKKHKVPTHLTYSCEQGSRPPCGKCLSCKDREALNVL
jgi:7-cyano-7-deazaguanine synthase